MNITVQRVCAIGKGVELWWEERVPAQPDQPVVYNLPLMTVALPEMTAELPCVMLINVHMYTTRMGVYLHTAQQGVFSPQEVRFPPLQIYR